MDNFAILIAALAMILAGLYLKKRYGESRSIKIGDYILVVLGVFALLSYLSFKPFSAQPNNWDMFHYYVGSKYFKEIGYTRLYACVTRAEAENEDTSVGHAAKRRIVRNLENNDLVPARTYFFDDTFCKARFPLPAGMHSRKTLIFSAPAWETCGGWFSLTMDSIPHPCGFLRVDSFPARLLYPTPH